MNRRKWRIIFDYAIGWTFALIFLSIVRSVGTVEIGNFKFDVISNIIISFTAGPLIGFISGYAQLFLEEKVYRRIPIQKFIALRFVYIISFLIVITFIVYIAYRFIFNTELSLQQFVFDAGSWAIYFYLFSVDFLFVMLRQINLMLGEGNLRKIVKGEFYTPREEKRIFMFLDLQSSTSIAEKLGHIRYSMLIQDCFNDLSVVIENEAEIYQYVGDEAVLTWKYFEGIKQMNCINAFYNFKEKLRSKKSYYLEKYGQEPFFKAGLHLGQVTVTEVGKYKKEIAYHGDAINTAARIQSQCNYYGKELLISGELLEEINKGTKDYTYENLGSIPLKGKENEVSIYAVSVCKH